MIRQGLLPDCVTACPNGVFYFGDENEDAVTNGDETVSLSQLLKDRGGYRFMEELGTQPRLYYLPPKDRLFPVERGLEGKPDNIKERYKEVKM
jgi:molybdopterin-containing oxidoreductase family iron-sulfur binding subunit